MNQQDNQIAEDRPSPYFVLFFLFTMALFFDAAATSVFMIQNGPDYEVHPLFRAVSLTLGPVYGPLLCAACKALAGFVLVLLHRPLSRLVLPAVTILSLGAGVYNLLAWPLYQMGYLHSLPF
jgi:hypothetical protein